MLFGLIFTIKNNSNYMARVIRLFTQLSKKIQQELSEQYNNEELPITTFPYKGELEEGVIFSTEEDTYLVPISSFKKRRSAPKKVVEEEYDLEEESDFKEESDEDFELRDEE